MRNFFKIKEGENYNHRNTFKYFEDYNLSLTQRLGKIAILGQPPSGSHPTRHKGNPTTNQEMKKSVLLVSPATCTMGLSSSSNLTPAGHENDSSMPLK